MTSTGAARRQRRGRTLRGRLALVALAVTAVWVAILTVAFNVLLAVAQRGQVDDLLRTRASAAAATVTVGPGGTLTVRDPSRDSALDAGLWIYQGHRTLERPHAREDLQVRVDALVGRGERTAQTSGLFPTKLYAHPLRHRGRQVGTLVTAVALDPYEDTERSALLASIALAAALLAGTYLATRTALGRALRPVAQMSEQAAEWSAEDVTHRFGRAERPRELALLASSLDDLLDRIAAALLHEQRFSAELSHELRTPLARIMAETELLLHHPRDSDELRRAQEQISASTEAMSRILEALMSEARTRVSTHPGRCRLREPVERAVAHLDLPDAGPSVTIEPETRPVWAGIDADLAERLVSPLLANAVRYARNDVTVTVDGSHDAVLLRVVDDGPGVGPGDREHIFEPGRRGDPRDGHSGAGLGLALARRLARSAGGDVRLEGTQPAVGAAFVVTLPPG